MSTATYVWRVLIDGEPTRLTVQLDQRDGDDAEAVRRVVLAVERNGITLEPEYVEIEVEVGDE